MSDDAVNTQKPKRSVTLILACFALLVIGVGAGTAAVAFGFLPTMESKKDVAAYDLSFVALEPMTVILAGDSQRRFLRFTAQVEVTKGAESRVKAVLPRIQDVLNTYLRSVSIADVENPAAMLEIRSQIFRRLELVVGDDVIKDLLVTEYVVN